MRRLRLEVVGPKDDYATYTLYLWVVEEVSELLREELGVEAEVTWVPPRPGEEYPRLRVEGEDVLVGIPSDPGYVYEYVRSYLVRRGLISNLS